MVPSFMALRNQNSRAIFLKLAACS